MSRDTLLQHKKEKDSLLAAVQAESVGIFRPMDVSASVGGALEIDLASSAPHFTYTKEEANPLPFAEDGSLESREAQEPNSDDTAEELTLQEAESEATHSIPIPIRIIDPGLARSRIITLPNLISPTSAERKGRLSGNTMKNIVFSGVALTFIVIFSVGFLSFKNESIYAIWASQDTLAKKSEVLVAGAATVLLDIGGLLESWLVPELIYKRTK